MNKMKLNESRKVNSVKEILKIAVEEAGDKIAFQYKNGENIKEKLKADISEACKELPIYKHISDIDIREKEFEKTTTNKIKR